MTVNQACEQILDVIETRGEQLEGVITPDTLVVGIARVGHEDQVESRMWNTACPPRGEKAAGMQKKHSHPHHDRDRDHHFL